MTKKHVPNGHPTQERITTLQLLVDLSVEEHTKKSEQLAALDLEINKQKDEAREKAAGYRETIKILVEKRDALALVVDSHKEERLVECIEEVNFERNLVTVKRRDNGEHVSERAMEGEERAALAQGELLNGDAGEELAEA